MEQQLYISTIVSERLMRYTKTIRSSFVGCCNDDVDGT